MGAYKPETLDEAVQFAEDKCCKYGEVFKVTDWRVAKRRCREHREYGEKGGMEGEPKVKTETNAAASNLPPRQSKQNGGTGVNEWRNQGNNGSFGSGNYDSGGFYGSGNGSGRGFNSSRSFSGGVGLAEAGGGPNLANYGPTDTRSILQRKTWSKCSYCGEVGHWRRECTRRLVDEQALGAAQPTSLAASSNQGAARSYSNATDGFGKLVAAVKTGASLSEDVTNPRVGEGEPVRLRDCVAMARAATEDDRTLTQGKIADVNIGGIAIKGKSGVEEAEEQSDDSIAMAEKECEASTANLPATGVRKRAEAVYTPVASDAAGVCAEETTEEPVK
ncbi:hypothetical protein PInf_014894 [Phytophthora infestans]|nr:hypothetical protein PInf_014894 [Phytophthora infestans]